MIVDIRGLGFPVTVALSDHVRRRLQFVLTRHSDRIRRVVVRLGDENGPRGGVDKFCRIQVYLIDAPVAVIEDIGADLYPVIDRASDRAGRAVVKHLERTRVGRQRAQSDAASTLPNRFDPAPHSATHSEGQPT